MQNPDSLFQQTGRYQLLGKLHDSDLGTVYRGTDTLLKREVSVKLMPVPADVEQTAWEEMKWRFLQEARAAGRLRHPNIVSVFDSGECEGFVYIVMEHRTGGTLDAFTENGRLLTVKQVLRIGRKLSSALDYAHRRWVVHREIKPANVLYDEESEEVILTNFGVARLLDKTRTRTGTVLGSPAYMSPEQIRGQKVDHRTDLYSLGVTLYQLLSGALPFEGGSFAQLMFRILYEPPRPLTEHRPELVGCVETIIDTALQKDPSKRFQTGREMAKSLKRCRETIGAGS